MKNQLYILTDDFYTPDETIEKQVLEMLESGIKIVQFRSKKARVDEGIVKNLVSLCEDFGASLIVNDDINLAKKVSAHGVHIGKDDATLTKAVEFLGKGKIYGVSCYCDMNLALNLQSLGASYVAFGSIFKSTTKPEAEFCDINTLDFSKLNIPTCLIGGINASNLNEILYKKADYLAIISATYKPRSIKENLANLQNIIKKD
ncbi:MAG: thiamine phosphate synthase [Campylobacteraceae bacterium]|nr:thiamine phosphate synthase [Campylobacteraceae bacterium]